MKTTNTMLLPYLEGSYGSEIDAIWCGKEIELSGRYQWIQIEKGDTNFHVWGYR